MKQRLAVLCTCLVLCSCNSSNDDHPAAPSAPPAPAPVPVAAASAPSASVQANFASGVPASSVAAAAMPSPDEAPDLSPGNAAYVSALYAPLLNDKHGFKLPYGTAVRILDPAQCGANADGNSNAICISRGELFGYEGSGAAGVQIDPATLGRNEPDLYKLISDFEQTPEDQLVRRRELAEKAFLLAPWNEEAYGQLTAVLKKTGDNTALRRAEFTHRCYSRNEPRPTGKRSFYQFDDQTGFLAFMFSIDVTPGAAKTDPKAAACPPRYYIRGGGEAGDRVAVGVPGYDTDYEISVTLVGGPEGAAGRPMYDPGAYPQYVTDFPWPEPRKALPAVTAAQRKQLKEMLREQLAGYTGKDAEQIKQALQADDDSSYFGFQILTGRLAADGRVFHLAQFRMGDAASSHYEGQPYIYAIAMLEQQPDGKFKPVEVTDRPGTYCGLREVLPDIDGDGTDEIVGGCEDSLDGAYPPILLRRVKGKWQFQERKIFSPGDVIVRARPVE